MRRECDRTYRGRGPTTPSGRCRVDGREERTAAGATICPSSGEVDSNGNEQHGSPASTSSLATAYRRLISTLVRSQGARSAAGAPASV